jgi:NAD(P)H-quinone oxidoreductase subunit 4
MMSEFPWLTAIVLLPVMAGLVIPWLPSRGNHFVRWYSLGVCLLDLLLITYVFACKYNLSETEIQLKDDFVWISSMDFHWRVGVDGLSIALILLTGFVTTLATIAAWPVTRNPRLFHFLMLFMYSGQLGLFVSQDILLFFVMWELELIPVYLLLSMWGGRRRLYAATKFLLYTAGGSIFLLVSILTISLWGSNAAVLDLEVLSNKTYPLSLQILVYLGFVIAFGVKLPALPLHTWLPDTHGEAHYSTCMLLAGILLKMGGYGFIRINMQLLPGAHAVFAPWIAALGAVQIVYAALVSLGQKNLKRRIAYSSISHMGFVLVGTGSLSSLGLSGSILQMVSHGLIGAALFFLAGTSYDRIGSLTLHDMGGWASKMPKMFAMFTICSMASLALPGMSGFVSELMVFFGMVTTSVYSPIFKACITVVEAIGIILTPIYLLSMVRQMFYGTLQDTSLKSLSLNVIDASPREVFVLSCLLLPMIGIGFYPELVVPLWNAKSNYILELNTKSFTHTFDLLKPITHRSIFLLSLSSFFNL